MAALIATAVVYVARPDTASGGALPPFKIVSPSSIPSSPHMTLTALYSRYRKKICAFGAAAVLTADAKIMADEIRPGIVTSAPITEDLPRPLKVIVLDSRTLQTTQQSRLTPLHPRVPSRGPPPHLQGNSSGLTHATNVAAVPTHPPAPSSAHGPGPAFTAAPSMRYGPASAGNNPNVRRPGTFHVPPTPTP